MSINNQFQDLVQQADLNSPAPETEPERQAWFLARARRIVDAYPDSPGGRALRELLTDVGEEERVMRTESFIGEINAWLLQSPSAETRETRTP